MQHIFKQNYVRICRAKERAWMVDRKAPHCRRFVPNFRSMRGREDVARAISIEFIPTTVNWVLCLPYKPIYGVP